MKKTNALFALTFVTLNLVALNSFAASLYPVVMGNRWGFMDKNGNLVINPQFERAEPFASGVAAIRLGSKWGYVDPTGKIVVNPQFDAAAPINGGLAAVKIGGRYGYINAEGQYIINPQFDAAGSFSEGRAVVRLKRRYGVEVKSHPPIVGYRESLRRSVTQKGRHKKQSGGHGQFGDVIIEVKPVSRGEGFQFGEKIHGGSIPKQWRIVA